MNAVVAVIATLLALAAWPLIRRLWLGPLGTGLANVAARGALSELAERHRALSSAAELLIRPTDEPGEVLAGAGLASEGLADNLLAALSDPPAEVWGRLAERSGDPAERVWLAHEAALRGATAAVGVVAGPQPLVQAELAVSRAAVGGSRPAAYHLLDQHGPGLPLVSRLLLQQRLARAAGDRELLQRTREQALRATVLDDPPACVGRAWADALAPWLDRRPSVPPNVRAWREQPPLPSTGDHGVGPPLREQFEAIRTMLLSLDQMVANQPGQALTDVGSVLRLVGRSVPRHEADWQLLYALVDELNRPAVRYAALAAVCRHVRETAEQSPRSADDYRFHLHLARDLTDGGLRARACLEAAAVHGALPGLAALADDELADAIAQESDPIFWATLLDEGGPWLFCLSESHPAKPALLADYLAQRWLQAAPEGAPEWLGGMLRLEGVLRDLVAGPVAPASWAWRGVPATEQALLQIAVWLLADDLARRGTERVVARYRQHTQRHLRLWARRL